MNASIEIVDLGNEFQLTAEQWVPRSVADVFAFFSDAANLGRITPDFVGFRMLDVSTPEIATGTLIRYRIKVHGFPLGWTTRIEEWNPGQGFVDFQVRGPYALWRHTHTFEAHEGGTRMRDQVRFRLPFGRLGKSLVGPFVVRDVRAIFEYRREAIARLFPIE